MGIPQPLAAPMYKAKALMVENDACFTTPNIAERDEVANTNPPCPIPLGNEHNNVHAVTVSSHRPIMFETNVVDMKPQIADEGAVSNAGVFSNFCRQRKPRHGHNTSCRHRPSFLQTYRIKVLPSRCCDVFGFFTLLPTCL